MGIANLFVWVCKDNFGNLFMAFNGIYFLLLYPRFGLAGSGLVYHAASAPRPINSGSRRVLNSNYIIFKEAPNFPE